MQNLFLRLKICGRVDCSYFQNPEDTFHFHQLKTTITNCWIPFFLSPTWPCLLAGKNRRKWVSEADFTPTYNQVRHLWEDTKRQEDTRGNLMPGVQSAGVGGKAKTSQRLHWYILAEVTNQSIWCHKHISLPRTSLIWVLQDVKMTNGEILELIKEIIWNQLYINIYFLVRDGAGGGSELEN